MVQNPYFLLISVFIGMVALIGIVVNDAIIIVDFINQERQRGAELRRLVVPVIYSIVSESESNNRA